MFIKPIGVLAAALLSFLSAEQQGCKPCRAVRPFRCSSSDYSSSSGYCCPDKKAREIVLGMQKNLEDAINACNYQAITGIGSYDFSFSTIEDNCLSGGGGCCTEVGTDFAAGRYVCGDKMLYFAPTCDYVKKYNNGTIVVTKVEVRNPAATPEDVIIHTYNYYYSPFYACQFKLTYIDGNVQICPNYVSGLATCNLC